MIAAHLRNHRHGEPGVGHPHQRREQAHQKLQREHDPNFRCEQPPGKGHPAKQNDNPHQESDAQDRLAADAIKPVSK